MIKDSTSLIRDELSTIQARLRIVERERDILEAESRRRAAEKEREEREKARLAGIAAAAATAAANAKAMAAAAAAAKMKKQPKKDTITPTKANVPVTPQDRSVATTSRASTPLTDVGTARSTASPAPTQSTPKSFVDVGSTPAPNNADASSSVRGKARGRPRGRGRGGLREAVLTHTPGSQVASRGGSSHVTSPAPIGTNTSPTSGRTTRAGSVNDSNSGATPLTPSTSAAISAAQAPSTAGSGSKPGGSTAGHAATTQGPILLTINMSVAFRASPTCPSPLIPSPPLSLKVLHSDPCPPYQVSRSDASPVLYDGEGCYSNMQKTRRRIRQPRSDRHPSCRIRPDKASRQYRQENRRRARCRHFAVSYTLLA